MGENKTQDHIKVVIRSRPLNDQEKAQKTPILVTCDSATKSVNVSTQFGGKKGSKTYNYDMVFGQVG